MVTLRVTLTCLLVFVSVGIECKPRAQHRQSYGSVIGSDEPAFSASSYDSLGIQPSRTGRGNQQQYWWQGPQSPFSEGAAQSQGVVSGGRPGQQVVGCSGDGCNSPMFSAPAVAASSSSSSSSRPSGGGGNCCNHYWQKPGHPCSTHQGNDCPRGFNCVNYRSCSNGVISHGSSGYAPQNPSMDELMNYGRPCGFSGNQVCCQDAPPRPQQPVVQQPPQTYYPPSPPAQQPVVEGPINYPPAPAFPTQRPVPTTQPPVYTPPPPPPPVYTPSPPIYYPSPPVYTPTKAPYRPPPPTSPVVYPTAPPTYKPTPPPPVYTPAPPAYYPPSPPVITTTKPAYKPPPPTQPSVAQGPPANLLPYPGCAAALKCVLEEYCSIDGIMVNTPVFLTEDQKQFRTPLMACLNVDTNQVGFCCRDPLYNDPWPADMPMPMPGMPKPPLQPVVQQTTPPPPPPPTQPPFIQCYPNEDCVQPYVCSSRGQTYNNLPNAKCQSYDGNAGVCCSRPQPTTQPPPPPPPPTQPVVIPPPLDYLPPLPQQPVVQQTTTPPPPPPPTQPPFIQCYPNEDCLQPYVCSARGQTYNNQANAKCQSYDGNVGVCCSRPPPTTQPPPPPPPPTQPVVIPPPDSYLPPPPPPQQPVEVPSDSYLPPPPPTPPPVTILPPPPPATQPVVSYVPPPPPPPPASAAQVLDNQCGISRPVSQLVGNGEAALGEYPWHAMVAMVNGSMKCSGALIGPKFVATSFHCVQGISPDNLRVRLGEQRVGATDEPLPHYEIPVTAVVGHPDFAEGSLFHDTAVLMLAAAAPTGQAHIAPICLPTQSEPQVSQCVVSGWGHDTLSGLQIGMLNKVQVEIVRNSDCQNSLQSTHLGKYFKLHKSFTCASTQNSINPCKVDGGSPLACKRPDGSHVLIGLSSWSVGCSNQQQPGVYSDVMAVAPWMQQQMFKPEASLVEQSNSAFQNQQQFQTQFGAGAGYGR